MHISWCYPNPQSRCTNRAAKLWSCSFCWPWLSLAFAADYGYDIIPADTPQVKPGYDSSKPNGEDQKPNYAEKPTTYKPNYGEKPSTYKPNSDAKPGYDNKPEDEEKPNYGSKPEGQAKPNYGTNQNNYKPKEEEKEKPGYDQNKPYVVKSKPADYDTTKPDIYKPKPEEEKPYSIAVEGFVYCKTPSTHYPIPRALAKVTCEAVDEVGVVKTVPICSIPTDAKGYFYATVSSVNESLKLKDCKAFLESSPENNCNVPTDVNKGITGFPISGDVYRVLNDKHTKLYSAQPFFYTSYEPKSVPNGFVMT
ncbi:hypothetical protein PTKIN_Ptkin14bG0217800 [Pterospermum kingtungense]